MIKPFGWRKEPARHALAAKGVATSNKLAASQLARIPKGAVRGVIGRRSRYASALKWIARRYKDEEDPVSAVTTVDYDKAVNPLFDTLADADKLVDNGDLLGSVNMLDLAKDQYEIMENTFNVISDDDARQWMQAVDRITEKNIATDRQQTATAVAAARQSEAEKSATKQRTRAETYAKAEQEQAARRAMREEKQKTKADAKSANEKSSTALPAKAAPPQEPPS